MAVDPAEAAVRRRGRRVALGLFYGSVAVFIAVLSAQVSRQVLADTRGAAVTSCRAGVVGLAVALERARAATESVDGRPEEALARFREALEPAWGRRDQVASSCRTSQDRALREAFDTVERLRYAEEAVVRRDGQDLSPLRRKVRDFVQSSAPDPGKSAKEDASTPEGW